MPDVFAFASIDSDLLGSGVEIPVCPVDWFFQWAFLMCDAFPFVWLALTYLWGLEPWALVSWRQQTYRISRHLDSRPLQQGNYRPRGFGDLVVWFFQRVFLMPDVFAFSSIGLDLLGSGVEIPACPVDWFFQCFLDVWRVSRVLLCKHSCLIMV